MVTHPHLTKHRQVHFFRHPHTKNEKAQSVILVEEEESILTAHQQAQLTRAARNSGNLPDEWDDKPVSLWKNSEFRRRWLANRNQFRPGI